MSSFGEKLLLLLSRDPAEVDYTNRLERRFDSPLSLLCRIFPDFLQRIVDKNILDFGCGAGEQVIALAQHGAKCVVGLDPNQITLERARAVASVVAVDPARIAFVSQFKPSLCGRFDFVISQNSMEHFLQPGRALEQMRLALNSQGRILITFGPPWFAPYGSHMHFFTRMPWVNLLFSERAVMNVRSRFRDDGARRYEEVESGLGRMTVAKFERLIAGSNMTPYFRRYECVKGLNWLGKLPIVRELLVNQITCELGQPGYPIAKDHMQRDTRLSHTAAGRSTPSRLRNTERR